jgi:ADP-ribose pyrophosphatase YjhB (NUDIX family)
MNKNSKIVGSILFWLAWPALFIYLRGSRRCRVVVSNGEDILILKNWLGSGQYTLPGGGLRNNEDPLEGISRELAEETGIIADKSQFKLIKPEYTVKERGHRYQCFGYSLEVNADQILSRQKFEISELKWASFKDVLVKYQLSSTARDLIAAWLTDNRLLD